MPGFQDLDVWTKAHELTLDVYKLTKKFPKDEKYRLGDQLRRSASSVPANIACPVESLGTLNTSIPRGLTMWNKKYLH